eukprot:jgi/Hompol1/2758/HPOL_001452-RA
MGTCATLSPFAPVAIITAGSGAGAAAGAAAGLCTPALSSGASHTGRRNKTVSVSSTLSTANTIGAFGSDDSDSDDANGGDEDCVVIVAPAPRKPAGPRPLSLVLSLGSVSASSSATSSPELTGYDSLDGGNSSSSSPDPLNLGESLGLPATDNAVLLSAIMELSSIFGNA